MSCFRGDQRYNYHHPAAADIGHICDSRSTFRLIHVLVTRRVYIRKGKKNRKGKQDPSDYGQNNALRIPVNRYLWQPSTLYLIAETTVNYSDPSGCESAWIHCHMPTAGCLPGSTRNNHEAGIAPKMRDDCRYLPR